MADDALKTLQDNIKSLDDASKNATSAAEFFAKANGVADTIGGPAGDGFKAGIGGAAKGLATGAGVGTTVGGIALAVGASAAAASAVPVIGTIIGAVAGLIAGISAFFLGKAAAEKKARAAAAQYWIAAFREMYKVLGALPVEFRQKAGEMLANEVQAAGGTFSLVDRGAGHFDLNIDIPDLKAEPQIRAVVAVFPDKLLKQLVPQWLKELNQQAAEKKSTFRKRVALGAVLAVGVGYGLYLWEKRK